MFSLLRMVSWYFSCFAMANASAPFTGSRNDEGVQLTASYFCWTMKRQRFLVLEKN